MTTENGATAVADTEVKPGEQSNEAANQDDTLVTSPDAESVAAETAKGAEEADASEEAEDLDFDLDKELSAKLGTDVSADTEAAQKPAPKGRTQAEAELDAFSFIREQTTKLLQDGDNNIQQRLRNDFDLEPEQTHRIWNDIVKPLLQNAAYLPQSGVNQLFVEDLRGSMEAEDFDAMFADGRRYSGRSETLEAAFEKVADRKDAEWQEKVRKGEYVARKTVKELTETAAQRAEARTRKAIEDGTYESGQLVEGRASATRDPRTSAEYLALPREKREQLWREKPELARRLAGSQ